MILLVFRGFWRFLMNVYDILFIILFQNCAQFAGKIAKQFKDIT